MLRVALSFPTFTIGIVPEPEILLQHPTNSEDSRNPPTVKYSFVEDQEGRKKGHLLAHSDLSSSAGLYACSQARPWSTTNQPTEQDKGALRSGFTVSKSKRTKSGENDCSSNVHIFYPTIRAD